MARLDFRTLTPAPDKCNAGPTRGSVSGLRKRTIECVSCRGCDLRMLSTDGTEMRRALLAIR